MFIKKEKEIPQEWRPMWVKRDRQEREKGKGKRKGERKGGKSGGVG